MLTGVQIGGVDIGNGDVLGGVLAIDPGVTVNVSGNVYYANLAGMIMDPTSVLDIEGNLVVKGNASLSHNGGISVDGTTRIEDTSSMTNNAGVTFDTGKLFVGNSPTDGGTYTNNGVTNVTYSSASWGETSINIYSGLILNNNTDLGIASFVYDAGMDISGTVSEDGVFQNSGVVDAGSNNLRLDDYSLLDLNGDGRFVMNSGICGAPTPGGYIPMRSSTGDPSDAMIDIASVQSVVKLMKEKVHKVVPSFISSIR